MAEGILLSLDQLRQDGGTQVRPQLDEEALGRYRTFYEEKRNVDAVKAVLDGEGNYWLYDGFHRIEAARQAGMTLINVDVRSGDISIARWLASGANARHGVRLSQEARRAAVRLAWANRPDQNKTTFLHIASQCGVDRATVRTVLVGDLLRASPQMTDREVAIHFHNFGVGIGEVSIARTRALVLGEAATDAREEMQDMEPPISVWPVTATVVQPVHADPVPVPEPAPDPESERITLPPVPQKIPKNNETPKKVEPVVLKDRLGKPVPELLKDVFNDPVLKAGLEQVALWMEMVDRESLVRSLLARHVALPYLRLDDVQDHLSQAEDYLRMAYKDILASFPYAVCPKCGGKGCTPCAGGGHVPQWRLAEINRGQV